MKGFSWTDCLFHMMPFVFLLCGCWAILYCDTVQHENVHKQVMLHDGCKDVYTYISLPWLSGSYALCVDDDYIESGEAQMLHGQNEIVSYNLFTVMCCMVLCSLFVGLCICWGD